MILRLSCLIPLTLAQFHFNQNDQNGLNGANPSFPQEGMSRGVVRQILTPYNITSNSNVENNSGVTIQFQLRGYSNPQSALPNGWTCVCPPEKSCNYLNRPPACYFGFTFIISAPDTSVRYFATEFVTLDSNGQLPAIQRNGWDQNYVVQLPSKPSAIDIFAHHLGPVINQADGSLIAVETLTHVDTFVVPLSDTLPAVGGVQSMAQQHAYQGKLLGTTLYLSYSISCTGPFIGPDCDLTCTPSTISPSVAACRSNSTGFFQVDNCKNCPWGIKENTYCQDEEGGVLDPYSASVVDTGYRTATIILGILTGIFLILLIVTLLAVCVLRRRQQPVEKEMTSFDRNGGVAATRPLLSATYRADQPTPLPRSQPPSLDAKPISRFYSSSHLCAKQCCHQLRSMILVTRASTVISTQLGFGQVAARLSKLSSAQLTRPAEGDETVVG
ncbi:hypothetical protein NECAME_06199 [Necator americanus]|uniref:Uncharacterized protein n=1 Tax=Necator americanus TaxID=51031 RepID=W2TXP1_NECAM|nr:hypothetical protein NECAME_06199 [Necator americanus]ETN85782.1 hypothetical protein NECAME_06199 [Necator americanus]